MAPFILILVFILTISTSSAAPDEPNAVKRVDFLTRQNAVKHRTGKYDLDALVLRRGDTFNFNIILGRDYNPATDRMRLEFGFRNSLTYIPVVYNQTSTWGARILEFRGRQLDLQATLPLNSSVGKWILRISTKVTNAPASTLQTYLIKDTIFVLFNPWHSDDQVYLEDESARQEYVNNEVGMLYTGTYYRPISKQWYYSQFDVSVLPTVIYLLDKLDLSDNERSDVVKVSRAVSAIANSNDDGGIVVGEWNGRYTNGVSPESWRDSATIFRQFVRTGYQPVKYGQCWVFGGITTTILRTLGIPARAITNYLSAHDTDGSLTVDKFFNHGSEATGVNGDTTWNYHVWSEAWMSRQDLPLGFGGWQAIDATPQEKSEDKYKMGPTSVEAVKQGKLRYAYDALFVYSEVNGITIHWHLDGRARWQWRKARVERGNYGKRIITKRLGSYSLYDEITQNYKYPEGSTEARQAYSEATRAYDLLALIEYDK